MMKTMLRGALLVAAAAPVSALAVDIPGSCLASMNVKDNSFTTGASTLSCVALERRRGELFTKINALPAVGIFNGSVLGNTLGEMEAELKKSEAEVNWAAWSLNISGNFLATLGLSACVETLGAGCAAAMVGKGMALVSIIDSAVDDSVKKQKSAAMRAEIAKLRSAIASSSPAADKVREQMVKDFTGMCADVKKYCVAN